MNKPTTNDITGDTIQTKASTTAYREGYDRIYKRKSTYDAQLSGGYYTFSDGRVAQTDEIDLYGMERSPFISQSDADCCTIGSMLLRESQIMQPGSQGEWRYATEDELLEVNDDGLYMRDLVAAAVESLTD